MAKDISRATLIENFIRKTISEITDTEGNCPFDTVDIYTNQLDPADNSGVKSAKKFKCFAFGQDYARTCRTWSERLVGERERIQRLGYDARFLRSWQYYLEICAASFAVGQTNVVQVELAHAR